MPFLIRLLEVLILVISVSVDAFGASLAYGAGAIKIPNTSALVISGICSGMLAFSMLVGNLLRTFIPDQLSRWICFAILLSIGLIKLFDSCIKSYIRKHQHLSLHLSSNNLRFILTVYADADCADADCSKILCVRESAVLAIALSLDSLTVGLGAALSGVGVLLPLILSLLLTFCAIKIGCRLGAALLRIIPFDLSYLSAGLFLLLAVLRLR